MKNLFIAFVAFIAITSSTNAQFGLGAGVLYGSESELGFTFRANYDINEKIGVYAKYSLLDSEDGASLTSIDVEGHYHFSEGTTKPYALVGLTNLTAKAEFLGASISASELGFNLGGGVRHMLSDKFSLFGEAKYSIVTDANQFIIAAGAHYGF